TEKLPESGTWVNLEGSGGRFLGCGHFQSGTIAVRVLSFEPVEDVDAFYRSRIASAWDRRESIGLTGQDGTNSFRLVFGEGDGLGGLIIDYYAGHAVLQCHTPGMYRDRERLADALRAVLGDELHSIYEKSSESLRGQGEAKDGPLWGDP